MKHLAKTPYMRNLWYLMKEFKVLPTNKDFRALTDYQLEMMINSVDLDNVEAERARKGLSLDADHMDTDFDEEVWNREVGEWDVLREGHDPDDIARQIDEATADEDRKNLISKFDSLDEYNEFLEGGGQTAKQNEVQEYIDRQIKVAEEKAKAMDQIQASKGKKKAKAFVDDNDLPEVQDNSNTSDNKGSNLSLEAMQRSIELFNSPEEENDDSSTYEDDDEFTEL